MAPTAKVTPRQPDTLPADFCEWDGGEAPGTLPDNFKGFDTATAAEPAPKQPAPPAPTPPNTWAAVDRAPEFIPPRPATIQGEAKVVSRTPQPKRSPAPAIEAREEEDEPKKSKAPMIGIAAAVVLLLAGGGFAVSKLSSKPTPPKQVAVTQTSSSSTEIAATNPTDGKPSPAGTSPAGPTPAATTDAGNTPHVSQQAMVNQLNAASKISRDMKGGSEQEAQTGFSGNGMEGLRGNSGVGNVFGSNGQPKVKADAPTKVDISAGVAKGLLLQGNSPRYPAIAKSARVSGTVVLQATIAKNGTIESLHAISGPAMLRQTALDAVKTWRYKPYMVNNQPVAVETTVEVIFNLGG